MSNNTVINDIFGAFQKSLDEEQELREMIRTVCREVEQLTREITTVLQVIHHSEEQISPACARARELLAKAHDGYRRLSEVVPANDYYKYHDHWRITTQRHSFLAALVVWLEQGILATHWRVAQILGLSVGEGGDGEGGGAVPLDVEDYLVGVLLLCNELHLLAMYLNDPRKAAVLCCGTANNLHLCDLNQSRLAVNSVTRGEFHRPPAIAKFVMELHAGFRLLSLKNDHLRKRFDALKYDVKKIEEVVYDLSVRGLLPAPAQ